MTWLDNQFDYQPEPDEPLHKGGWVTALYLNNFHANFFSAWNKLSESNEPEPDEPTSKYRENPPRFTPTGRAYDRHGCKRY